MGKELLGKQGHASCKISSLQVITFLCQLNFVRVIRLSLSLGKSGLPSFGGMTGYMTMVSVCQIRADYACQNLCLATNLVATITHSGVLLGKCQPYCHWSVSRSQHWPLLSGCFFLSNIVTSRYFKFVFHASH